MSTPDTSTLPDTALGHHEPDPRRWQALALVCVAFFMTVLDGTIVTVAPPSIKSSLHVPDNTLQWVLIAYTITFGGLLLLGGRAADLFVTHLLPRYLLVGVGMAFSFIPMSIAALAGVAPREAGLASGLINTAQQIGAALGVAIAATVAFTNTKTLLTSGHSRRRRRRAALPSASG